MKKILFFSLIISVFIAGGSIKAYAQIVDLGIKKIGLTTDLEKSYLAKLSFTGDNTISKWELSINCSKDISVMTVPGEVCNDPLIMGLSKNSVNVIDKDFWFRNYSNKIQTVPLELKGFDANGNLLGIDRDNISLPSTTKGSKTWSHVTVTSPNGIKKFKAGKNLKITWKTESDGTFTFSPSSRVEILLIKDHLVVKKYETKNSGSKIIKIPTTALTGSDYKVMVTVYSDTGYEGTAMSDESDDFLSITGVKSLKLTKEDVIKGSGAKVKKGQTISIHYTGMLLNGTKFDSSYERGQLFTFKLGDNQVINGLNQGLLGMRVGGRRSLIIPANLAYGEKGIPGTIPGNSSLFFDVEVVDVIR